MAENEQVDPLAEEAYQLAYEYEATYGNCSQCVFGAVQDVLEIGDDATFQAAHTLAGGCALTSEGTCGALSGGLLAIGAVYGRDKAHFAGGKNKESSRIAKRLFDRFQQEFGGVLCSQVQTRLMGRSFNLWTDMKEFEAAGGHKDKCPTVTGRSAQWVVEILLEERKNAVSRAAADTASPAK